jgi:hypothetical protein
MAAARQQRRLELLGYWFHERAPDAWPLPQWLQRRWRANERELVVRYLRAGRRLVGYAAAATCRFACGARHLGSGERTDGTFIWPDGLAHYVARHGVALPEHFVAHVLARGGTVAPFVLPRVRPGLYDARPWRRWARENGAVADLRGWRRVAAERAVSLRSRLALLHGERVRGELLLEHRTRSEVVLRARDGSLTVWSLRRQRPPQRLAGWRAWPALPNGRSRPR